GISVWSDDGLTPGTPDWTRSIEEEIQKCSGLVVILTPDSDKSIWVRNEIIRAQKIGIPIYPILGKGDSISSIPIMLESTQYVDIRKDFNSGLKELIDTLVEDIGINTLPKEETHTIPLEPKEIKSKENNLWTLPIDGYKPIPFGKSTTNKALDNYKMPYDRPLFGEESIPFRLKLQGDNSYLECIEVKLSHPTDKTPSPLILPGAKNVLSAYLLIRAGKGFTINDHVEFEGMRIGVLEFYFEDEEIFTYPLILGKNIRDGSYTHPDLVGYTTDPNIKQVWLANNDQILDMLMVKMPNPPRNVTSFRFIAECEGVRKSYTDFLPRIQVCGLTYKLK
ncbi:MAG: toll/interleukin-1 receptor domain-containing protein, partial [Anaerolineales bacterium]